MAEGAKAPTRSVGQLAHSPSVWNPRRVILFPISICMAKQGFAGTAAVNTDLSPSSVLHAVKQLAFLAYLRKPAALKLFTIYGY